MVKTKDTSQTKGKKSIKTKTSVAQNELMKAQNNVKITASKEVLQIQKDLAQSTKKLSLEKSKLDKIKVKKSVLNEQYVTKKTTALKKQLESIKEKYALAHKTVNVLKKEQQDIKLELKHAKASESKIIALSKLIDTFEKTWAVKKTKASKVKAKKTSKKNLPTTKSTPTEDLV